MKSAALALFGELHIQLGPVLKVMTLSNIQDDGIKKQVEKKFDSYPHDPSSSVPTRRCLVADEDEDNEAGVASTLGMEIPKTDLISELPGNIFDRLVSF